MFNICSENKHSKLDAFSFRNYVAKLIEWKHDILTIIKSRSFSKSFDIYIILNVNVNTVPNIYI